MELTKTKYKQTEVGLIPEDWEISRISDLSVRVGDGIHSTPLYSESGQYYFINGNNLKEGKIIYSETTKKVSDSEYLIHQRELNDSTILISINGTIGNLAFYNDEKIILGKSAAYINLSNRLNKYFAFQILQTQFIKHYFENELTGSTIKNLGVNSIRNTPIPLPPLPEQKAIAQVLSDTDSLIQTLEQKLAKKRAIKQGAMQQLLTPKEDWVIKKLGELARFRRGSFPQPYGLPQWYDEHNGTPFVQVYDVDKNMRLKSTTKQKISDLAKDKSVFVEKGNIILTIQGSIGRIALTQYDAYVDRTLLIFTDYKEPIDKVFFSYVIQEKFRIEKENAPGGIIKTITKEALSKFDIPLPKTLKGQLEIGIVLSDMDAEIGQLEQKLDKYKLLKQGLMQELLTGRIRLV